MDVENYANFSVMTNIKAAKRPKSRHAIFAIIFPSIRTEKRKKGEEEMQLAFENSEKGEGGEKKILGKKETNYDGH